MPARLALVLLFHWNAEPLLFNLDKFTIAVGHSKTLLRTTLVVCGH